MSVVLENNHGVYIEVQADEVNQWVYARWIGQLTVEEVKAGAMAVLEMIQQTGYDKLLNDNKQLLGHWNDANEWIATEWIPQAIALNLRKFAHVLSDYSYGQLSAEEMQTNVGDVFKMRLFESAEKAQEWLLAQ